MRPPLPHQRGVVLVVCMILLVLITLFALAAINMSTVNLRMTTNSQIRSEAIAAAQQSIEQVVSTNFTANPATTTRSLSISIPPGTGGATYSVEIRPPECKSVMTFRTDELDFETDWRLLDSGQVKSDLPNLPSTGSQLQVYRQWEVTANVIPDSAGSGAAVTLHQGVAQVVEANSACN